MDRTTDTIPALTPDEIYALRVQAVQTPGVSTGVDSAVEHGRLVEKAVAQRYEPRLAEYVRRLADMCHEYELLSRAKDAADRKHVAVPDSVREPMREAIAGALGEAMDCIRTWDAWRVGTMSESDFVQVAEQAERLDEIVDAAIEALSTAPLAPSQEPELTGDIVLLDLPTADRWTTPLVFKDARFTAQLNLDQRPTMAAQDPLTRQEILDLTSMIWGAPCIDGPLQDIIEPVIRQYEQLLRTGQRPRDPASRTSAATAAGKGVVDMPPDPPHQTGVGLWCAPGPAADQRRAWLLRYDDASRGEAVFYDEDEARQIFAAAEGRGWNCHLFGHAPRMPFPRTTGNGGVDERETFEAKARPRWTHPEDFDQRIGSGPGVYNSIEVQAAWWGWQQHAAHAAPSPALTTQQILLLERRSNMTDDEAIRFARSVETACMRSAPSLGIDAPEQQERPSYRLLGVADIIQRGDEFIGDDGVTWCSTGAGIWIGMRSHALKSARRRIDTAGRTHPAAQQGDGNP